MTIRDNIEKLLDHIERCAERAGRSSSEIDLVVVTKTRSFDEIEEVYQLGFRNFGESRVQEALIKMDNLQDDIHWHFIGPLQKNKVSKIIGRFDLIHSVDTLELAKKISIASQEKGLKTPVLLEVNSSQELAKHGLSPLDWEIAFSDVVSLHGIKIEGLMTMAPLTDDQVRIRNCFRELHELRERLRKNTQLDLGTLSMGMSNDYEIAIEEGSTLLRIGTAIFS